MKLHITLPSICRPPEYKTFLEQQFLDAVLDYESDPERIKFLLHKDKWENRRIWRKGRDAIKPFTTEKERINLKVEWEFK